MAIKLTLTADGELIIPEDAKEALDELTKDARGRFSDGVMEGIASAKYQWRALTSRNMADLADSLNCTVNAMEAVFKNIMKARDRKQGMDTATRLHGLFVQSLAAKICHRALTELLMHNPQFEHPDVLEDQREAALKFASKELSNETEQDADKVTERAGDFPEVLLGELKEAMLARQKDEGGGEMTLYLHKINGQIAISDMEEIPAEVEEEVAKEMESQFPAIH